MTGLFLLCMRSRAIIQIEVYAPFIKILPSYPPRRPSLNLQLLGRRNFPLPLNVLLNWFKSQIDIRQIKRGKKTF